MKKSKWFLGTAISGILAVVCFVVGTIASFNLPSGASYGVAKAYGDTSSEDFLRMLPNIMIIACGVFLVVAIVLLVIGLIQKKKGNNQ
ncbi:hypothetical protein [Candidatus Soleaferrea massiliensis]|uniref:hypothetical protein n=1 Tax=Candidatus Soleaferrea massiliensis TaxID=1470354 RepID=UPI00058E0B3C|nr:hypothetical protein [Candidatus Soleaferrea massiliensis]